MDQGKRVRRRKNKAVQELGRLIERRQMQRKLYAFPLSFLRQHLKATPNQRNKKKKKRCKFYKRKRKRKIENSQRFNAGEGYRKSGYSAEANKSCFLVVISKVTRRLMIGWLSWESLLGPTEGQRRSSKRSCGAIWEFRIGIQAFVSLVMDGVDCGVSVTASFILQNGWIQWIGLL